MVQFFSNLRNVLMYKSQSVYIKNRETSDGELKIHEGDDNTSTSQIRKNTEELY